MCKKTIMSISENKLKIYKEKKLWKIIEFSVSFKQSSAQQTPNDVIQGQQFSDVTENESVT